MSKAGARIIEAFREASEGKLARVTLENGETWTKEPGWQPIETAPRMKTIILFAVTDMGDDGSVNNWKMETGFWHTGYDEWSWGGHVLKPYDHKPTHWQPLPSPPKPVSA